jgi:hypothetical protein
VVRRFENSAPLAVREKAKRASLVTPDADMVDCALNAPFPQNHRGFAPPILKDAVDRALMSPEWAVELGDISKTLKTVHHSIASDYPIIVRIEERGEERVLLVTSPREMLARALRREGSVVVTDANADLHLPVLAKIVNYAPPLHVFTAPDGAPIERTWIRTHKATRKAWFKKGQLALDSSLVNLVKATIEWAKEAQDASVLAIISVPAVEVVLRCAAGLDVEGCKKTWKSMRQPKCALDAFSEALAPTLASWKGTLLTAHYGATRGLNDMAEADALATIGDPWMNLNESRNDGAYLGLAHEWEARYEARCRAELEQAHGRLRTVHRTRPGRALHVGAVMPGGSGWVPERVIEKRVDPRRQIEQVDAKVGLTQLLGQLRTTTAVARAIGCSQPFVSSLVSGRAPISRSVAERIQALLTAQGTELSRE